MDGNSLHVNWIQRSHCILIKVALDMLHVGDSGQFAVIVQDAFIDMGEP
ncbi:MAG: hypothetical protein K8R11_02760 [Methanococcoides sp.]|nr:hypothetical protein [Methanococcoides sp.]